MTVNKLTYQVSSKTAQVSSKNILTPRKIAKSTQQSANACSGTIWPDRSVACTSSGFVHIWHLFHPTMELLTYPLPGNRRKPVFSRMRQVRLVSGIRAQVHLAVLNYSRIEPAKHVPFSALQAGHPPNQARNCGPLSGKSLPSSAARFLLALPGHGVIEWITCCLADCYKLVTPADALSSYNTAGKQ